ncbi:MAG: MFS transporter [Pleurocapsa sp. SU_196_0]|nr:MFS transporter [Pleurocapsa sp. SU_196_0]
MNSWRSGLRAFRVIALGQTVSMLGNEISGFALTIWAFEKTGTATALALVSFFYLLPLILTLPFAGAIVDRSNRKRMMLVADAGAFMVTLALLALQLLGWLEVWQVLAGWWSSG